MKKVLSFLLFVCALFYNNLGYSQFNDSQNKITHNVSGYIPGIYTSFEQFLDDAPAIPSFKIKVNKETGFVELYKINGQDSAGVLVKNAWGISVGNELYKISKGKLLAIEKVGSGFMLSKFVDPKRRKNCKFSFYLHSSQITYTPFLPCQFDTGLFPAMVPMPKETLWAIAHT